MSDVKCIHRMLPTKLLPEKKNGLPHVPGLASHRQHGHFGRAGTPAAGTGSGTGAGARRHRLASVHAIEGERRAPNRQQHGATPVRSRPRRSQPVGQNSIGNRRLGAMSGDFETTLKQLSGFSFIMNELVELTCTSKRKYLISADL
jgi:hypothetical protein